LVSWCLLLVFGFFETPSLTLVRLHLRFAFLQSSFSFSICMAGATVISCLASAPIASSLRTAGPSCLANSAAPKRLPPRTCFYSTANVFDLIWMKWLASIARFFRSVEWSISDPISQTLRLRVSHLSINNSGTSGLGLCKNSRGFNWEGICV